MLAAFAPGRAAPATAAFVVFTAAATAGPGVAPSGQAATAEPSPRVLFEEQPDGSIAYGDLTFASWADFLTSEAFRSRGLRCGTPATPLVPGLDPLLDGGRGGDCSLSRTDPLDIYDPTQVTYRIPVVVHVIRDAGGTVGNLTLDAVHSQIDILNEDFLALAGSLGEDGTNAEVEFSLATEDPDGNPTDGVTYSNNTEWFNDDGVYWETLAWDTNRYLNIYTNRASGTLGYVPDLPQGGVVGQTRDRVVVFYRAFGRDSGFPPYHQGRTATHEVGHYLGLQHTFSGGCGSLTACYTTADLICDTQRQDSPDFGCPNSFSCDSPNPIRNYMNYTDDLCMAEFTPEQARRLRCTLEHWRPDLFEIVATECRGDVDGSGDVGLDDVVAVLAAWGPCSECPEDLDEDGRVGLADLLVILSAWGACP